MTLVLSRLGYWAVALLALLVALFSFRFLSFNPNLLQEYLRPNLLNNPVPFYLHVTFAPIALVIGVWQFIPITRRSVWHRWEGRVYVACVLIASLSGFVVAFTTAAGMAAGLGFAILAALWFGSTAIAYSKVRTGRYAEHRRWMIRSYALTCAAITLRLIVPVGIAAKLDFATAYLVAAWGCWIINVAIAELIVRYSRPPGDLPADRVAATAKPLPV
jgi:hypothetical protein